MARTHVILEDAVLQAIDDLVGPRERSRFLEEAAREKLSRIELEAALRATSGIVDERDYPEWATPERAAAWVRTTRGTESAA